MTFSAEAYATHVTALCNEWREALDAHGYDAALITAGAATMHYDDDQSPPYRANPHLTRWFPCADSERACLLVGLEGRPRIFFVRPQDYWHVPAELPEWIGDALDVEVFPDADQLALALRGALADRRKVALVGPSIEASNLSVSADNPRGLCDHLAYLRAYKSSFEIARMEEATGMAVAGHLAARDTFYDGGSEFEAHMALSLIHI